MVKDTSAQFGLVSLSHEVDCAMRSVLHLGQYRYDRCSFEPTRPRTFLSGFLESQKTYGRRRYREGRMHVIRCMLYGACYTVVVVDLRLFP